MSLHDASLQATWGGDTNVGLRNRLNHENSAEELFRMVVTQRGDLLIVDACRTVEQSTIDLWQSPAGFLAVSLYCLSRSLMIVVDVLRDALSKSCYSKSFVDWLQKAAISARVLKDFLLKNNSWGVHWTQEHTLQAVLARLDQKDLPDTQSTAVNDGFKKGWRPDTRGIVPCQTPMEITQTYRTDVPHALDPSNVLFNMTDWDAYFAAYNQESILWPTTES